MGSEVLRTTIHRKGTLLEGFIASLAPGSMTDDKWCDSSQVQVAI